MSPACCNVSASTNAQDFQLWTCPDAQHKNASTPGLRTYFHFGVSGHGAGETVSMNIMNLNKQGRLYSQDYRPWFWRSGMAEWTPLR